MKIGVPKEIKILENRVGLVPASVRELTDAGHEVIVETLAGSGSGFSDTNYKDAGARIATDAASVFAEADLIVHGARLLPVQPHLALEKRAMARPDRNPPPIRSLQFRAA